MFAFNYTKDQNSLLPQVGQIIGRFCLFRAKAIIYELD